MKKEEVTLQRVYWRAKRIKELKVTEEFQARRLVRYKNDLKKSLGI